MMMMMMMMMMGCPMIEVTFLFAFCLLNYLILFIMYYISQFFYFAEFDLNLKEINVEH